MLVRWKEMSKRIILFIFNFNYYRKKYIKKTNNLLWEYAYKILKHL